MNNRKNLNGSHHSLRLLEEISQGDAQTQRDLSKKLGVALGLVNSYLKNLISKGYITVKLIPPKRYAYYLTTAGFAEKTRLTFQHLRNFTSLYREARRTFKQLFQELHAEGVKKIAFAGVDEVAEIAYLSLQEAELELTGVLDDDKQGSNFFGFQVKSFDEIENIDLERIILTGFMKRQEHYSYLLNAGIPKAKIILPDKFIS